MKGCRCQPGRRVDKVGGKQWTSCSWRNKKYTLIRIFINWSNREGAGWVWAGLGGPTRTFATFISLSSFNAGPFMRAGCLKVRYEYVSISLWPGINWLVIATAYMHICTYNSQPLSWVFCVLRSGLDSRHLASNKSPHWQRALQTVCNSIRTKATMRSCSWSSSSRSCWCLCLETRKRQTRAQAQPIKKGKNCW